MDDKWARTEGDKNVYASNPGRIVCIKPSKYLPFETQAQNNAQWEKDARLIAAAPAMLAVLERLMGGPLSLNELNELMTDAAEVVAKAKGGE